MTGSVLVVCLFVFFFALIAFFPLSKKIKAIHCLRKFSSIRENTSLFTIHYLDQGPVSRKSRNFSGGKTKVIRVTKLCSYFNVYSLYNIWKRPTLQNKRVRVLGMAFRARKVFGSFDKHTPGLFEDNSDYYLHSKTVHNSQVPHNNSSSSLLKER